MKRFIYLKVIGIDGKTEADKAFGITLYRPEEDIHNPASLRALLELYVKSNIKTVLGLSFKDVMLLPASEFILLQEFSERASEKGSSALTDLLEEK